jgi:dihydroxy-acid dehydratase
MSARAFALKENPMTKKPTNGHAPAGNGTRRHLRSQEWFNNPHNPGMTALYLERYLNFGLTRA